MPGSATGPHHSTQAFSAPGASAADISGQRGKRPANPRFFRRNDKYAAKAHAAATDPVKFRTLRRATSRLSGHP